ncbi:uncharacterized protein LOC108424713 [Pygocentrus nattereri]|uniref:Immunoglobulin V-set domain-containing protein n=1 Tax=Pygocentrus nattereri TaxID=42514 RepID=A0A3B4D9E1_PYGNA|nr:uncharacterized protein LOC108424713 [Pygocentrus nattereri]
MNPPLIVWFLIISSATAYGDIVYLRKEANASVELPCVCSTVDRIPFAFSLHRGPNETSSEVLYRDTRKDPSINKAYAHRISLQDELSSLRANVNITHLQENDTDLYYCFFYCKTQNAHLKIPGTTKFFLHVGGDVPEESSCFRSDPLLYTLSAAAVLLFLCVLIIARANCKSSTLCQKKTNVQPIYEDMRMMRPSNQQEAETKLL